MNITSPEFARILKAMVTDPIVAAIQSLRPQDSPTINVYVDGAMDPEEVAKRVHSILYRPIA